MEPRRDHQPIDFEPVSVAAPRCKGDDLSMTGSARNQHGKARILIRPEPGFYLMRWRAAAPLVPAVIYQLCPMVIPQPTTATGPHPDEWCRPLDRSRRFEARINDMRVDIDRVWTARSLRAISAEVYVSQMRTIRRNARLGGSTRFARPERRVDLNRLPPLF